MKMSGIKEKKKWLKSCHGKRDLPSAGRLDESNVYAIVVFLWVISEYCSGFMPCITKHAAKSFGKVRQITEGYNL